jgi:drug/metabolite transporter (DMT)-like permease
MRGSEGNLRGAALMTGAMAGFAVEDMLLKAAAATLPRGEVITLFGLGGLAVFAGLALWNGQPVVTRAMLARTMLIRSGFEVMGRLFYALAILLTPLSTASAILQSAPLIVVAGAALVFGETVGMRRWLAVLAGFAGVLLIIRPGTSDFDVLSLLAVLGTIGFAGRDLATRAAPPQLTNLQLGVTGFAMLTLAGLILLVWQGEAKVPDTRGAGLVAAAVAVGVVAYASLTAAMRTGEIGAVTPFRYTRLVFAMLLGAAVFGERPDGWTLAGSAVVVAAGLFILLSLRADSRRAAASRDQG